MVSDRVSRNRVRAGGDYAVRPGVVISGRRNSAIADESPSWYEFVGDEIEVRVDDNDRSEGSPDHSRSGKRVGVVLRADKADIER